MTDTRSSARRCRNQSDVMIDTIDADEAWWPPTFSAAGIGPDPVRVVDDRRGQPEHLALDLGQRVQAGGFLLQLGHG